jgi:GT2 family glycosyltransferase
MRIGVVYATLGRPDIMADALGFMREQTQRPDVIVISAVAASDVMPVPDDLNVKVVFGPKGLTRQRNTGVEAIRDDVDAVVFFDDDYAPDPGFVAAIDAILTSNPAIAGVNGQTVADGITGPGYNFDQARQILADFRPPPFSQAEVKPVRSLYGCNMAVRLAMADGIVFDEALPLYAWQEDVDYSTQLARRGSLIWCNALGGVHLGVKRARLPGLRTGYSQIANPIYLRRKRTMALAHAYTLMGKNLAANIFRSFSPEPWCDRRGRLTGNFMALQDFVGGKLHPRNILNLD